jgi:hypothetical protein
MPAFLAPYAAKLAGSLISWLVILGIIGALFGLWRWERHDRIAAEKGEKAAQLESGLHAADAARWHTRSDQGDQALDQVVAAYKRQTDLVKQGRANETALRASLDGAHLRATALQETADQLSKETDDESQKAPSDVVPLGPIVLRHAGSLFSD